MNRKHYLLIVSAVAGLLGIGLLLAGSLYAGVILELGVCLFLAALAFLERKKSSTTGKQKPGRRIRKHEISSYGLIVEAEGWTQGVELDEASARTLHAGEQTVHKMRRIASSLDDVKVARTINDLCATGEAIITRIRRNPERLSGVRRFFDFHLPATGSILNKYVTFLNSDVYTNEMEYQVKQIEELLTRIRRHFLKHLHRLVQDDLLVVEIEVNSFERVMRSEGL